MALSSNLIKYLLRLPKAVFWMPFSLMSAKYLGFRYAKSVETVSLHSNQDLMPSATLSRIMLWTFTSYSETGSDGLSSNSNSLSNSFLLSHPFFWQASLDFNLTVSVALQLLICPHYNLVCCLLKSLVHFLRLF